MGYGNRRAFLALPLMIAALGAAAHAQGTENYDEDALRRRVARAPKAVAAFIKRRASCYHFGGEEPYDRERAAFLNKVQRELRCNRLDRDEAVVRHRYRHVRSVLRLLDDTRDLDG